MENTIQTADTPAKAPTPVTLTTTVELPNKHMPRYHNPRQATLSLANGRLTLKGAQTFLDVATTEITQVKLQLNILFIYTAQGMTEVAIPTSGRSREDWSKDIDAWQQALNISGVTAKNPKWFFKMIYIFGGGYIIIRILQYIL